MEKILDAIYKRKSTRSFSDKSIREDVVDKIVKAGASAPSAYNRQPWEFFVVLNKKVLKEISSFDPFASMAKDASFAILVCANTDLENEEGFWVQDCAAAVQNMLIAATALGLGSVWTTVYPFAEMIEKFRKYFELSPETIPFALIPFGYPTECNFEETKMLRENNIKLLK